MLFEEFFCRVSSIFEVAQAGGAVPGAGTLIGEFETDIDVSSLMIDWRF